MLLQGYRQGKGRVALFQGNNSPRIGRNMAIPTNGHIIPESQSCRNNSGLKVAAKDRIATIPTPTIP